MRAGLRPGTCPAWEVPALPSAPPPHLRTPPLQSVLPESGAADRVASQLQGQRDQVRATARLRPVSCGALTPPELRMCPPSGCPKTVWRTPHPRCQLQSCKPQSVQEVIRIQSHQVPLTSAVASGPPSGIGAVAAWAPPSLWGGHRFWNIPDLVSDRLLHSIHTLLLKGPLLPRKALQSPALKSLAG